MLSIVLLVPCWLMSYKPTAWKKVWTEHYCFNDVILSTFQSVEWLLVLEWVQGGLCSSSRDDVGSWFLAVANMMCVWLQIQFWVVDTVQAIAELSVSKLLCWQHFTVSIDGLCKTLWNCLSLFSVRVFNFQARFPRLVLFLCVINRFSMRDERKNN